MNTMIMATMSIMASWQSCQFINPADNWTKPGKGQDRQAESMRVNNLQPPHSFSSTAPQPFAHSNLESFLSYLVKDVTRPFARALEMKSKWEYGSMTQYVGRLTINDILDSKCLHFLHHQFHSVLMTNYDKLSKKESKHKSWHHSGIEFVAMSLSKHVRNIASIIQYPSNQIKHGQGQQTDRQAKTTSPSFLI